MRFTSRIFALHLDWIGFFHSESSASLSSFFYTALSSNRRSQLCPARFPFIIRSQFYVLLDKAIECLSIFIYLYSFHRKFHRTEEEATVILNGIVRQRRSTKSEFLIILESIIKEDIFDRRSEKRQIGRKEYQ